VWNLGAPKSQTLRVILAWAQLKKVDVGNEQECGWDQLEAPGEILRDVVNRAKAHFTWLRGWCFNSIEESITNAIEREYARLCHHPRLHTDGDGRMLRCCIRKHLFNEMLEALPKLPPVRKLTEHRGYGN
jgi:hypothetical protein